MNTDASGKELPVSRSPECVLQNIVIMFKFRNHFVWKIMEINTI
mgnify:CR=1 FL=1